MTRRQQLWALIFLSAATAGPQYILQGALATGADLGTFHRLFWYADYGLWGVRALIEAWVVVYLFTTQAKSRWHSLVLIGLEVSLIALITLTLGPALRSVGMATSVLDSLREVTVLGVGVGDTLFWLWNYGIGAYTSLMMVGAGFAYRVQPGDIDQDQIDARQLQETLRNVQEARDAYRQRADEMRDLLITVDWAFALEPRDVAKILAISGMDKRPGPARLSELYGKRISPAEVALAYQEGDQIRRAYDKG